MAEKRMLIVPAELAKRIDDNRGEMSRSDFIEFLIDNQLKENAEAKKEKPAVQYATKEEVQSLEQDLKKLLKSFLDFFVNYGLEMGVQPKEGEFEGIAAKLEELEHKDKGPASDKGRATIKWK
ncbi:MAG: hypothetical protein HYX80_06840 [Chloroflexi bacterium]|nr:hypothetical protein [Chloroflexota bacterium]